MLKRLKILILIGASRAYGRGLLKGISKYSRLHGQWLFQCEFRHIDISASSLAKLKPDGIITQINTPKNAEVFIKSGIPTIALVVNHPIPNLPNIMGNFQLEGQIASKYFLDKGFKNYGFYGYTNAFWSKERCASFVETINEAGYKVSTYNQKWAKFHKEWYKEQANLCKWLKQLPRPAAIFVAHDDCGRYLLEACQVAGLSVPEQIAVLGIDNDDTICEFANPPLSSIAVNTEKAGYEAAEYLEQMILGKETEYKSIIINPTRIVSRQSTDILAIEDQEVAKALCFIRQHGGDRLMVDSVVEVTTLGRRALEQRFKKILKRSIYQEIRRVHLEKIKRILLETSMPVYQIALTLDYTSHEHLGRFFRKEVGMTPLEYRRKCGA